MKVAAFTVFAIFGLALSASAPGSTRSDGGHLGGLCREAALRAAERHDVPREMMLAITLTETRRRKFGETGPWPWTLNIEGKGFWFERRDAALDKAREALAAGRRSMDLGCFQINYRWHGEHFASLDDMLEPRIGGDYAARLLRSLYDETGDWMRAAGYYHSRTPKHATRYRKLIARAVSEIAAEAPVALTQAPRLAPQAGPARTRPRGVASLAEALPDKRLRTPEAPILGYAAPPPKGGVRLRISPARRADGAGGQGPSPGGLRLIALSALAAGPLVGR